MQPHTDRGQGDRFPTDPSGLPEAGRLQLLELAPGATLDLEVGPVAKRLGDATVRMLGYNGSVPGPTLKVPQGSELLVHVTNHGDLDTTVHWHGLRLENRYDGVPHETQAPIPVGGEFTYRIQFPDPGLYWYHPHIQGLGKVPECLVHGLVTPRRKRVGCRRGRCGVRRRRCYERRGGPRSRWRGCARWP